MWGKAVRIKPWKRLPRGCPSCGVSSHLGNVQNLTVQGPE